MTLSSREERAGAVPRPAAERKGVSRCPSRLREGRATPWQACSPRVSTSAPFIQSSALGTNHSPLAMIMIALEQVLLALLNLVRSLFPPIMLESHVNRSPQFNRSCVSDDICVRVRIYILSDPKKGYHDTHPAYPQVPSTCYTTHNLRLAL